ncbi:dihydrofolate synthase / folylpolyglutamate synthase [Alkalibacterium subtropicum]|uniref:tetrahydrofolate synthase n=1 Tax=Alkalibacterium subtropicum TaxID=753702 RepID=A0A1I1JH96_9LACT|nr:folylpolyglutamate synthase/dihydrofolate synthase family protein [Alkalibacterium subtropicum]SFC47887.1 dihydrofolate synthase / folylpolyglutamate synthase [Alkalibacterium subtropicum]
MVRDMKDVIALVNTNRGNGKKESLDRMRTLLKKIGNPEQRLAFVHIAGTNGKGSTASFISQILIQANLKTGIFTSPHLEKVNERIRINDAFISDDDFIRTTEKVAAVVDAVEKECGERLYSFEILTAVALLYYKEQKCDIVVLEAGIGGRLDATNTIPVPEVAIITSIGMDHTKMLGNTLEKIAGEKAGIIKEKGEVVLPSFTPSIEEVFQIMSEAQQASIHKVDINDIKELNMTERGSTFSYKQFDKVTVSMVGKHQVSNALLAIEAALILKEKGYDLSDEEIIKGIKASYWPGRMEKIQDAPTIFIDGAHNPEGVERLRESIETLFPGEKLTIVVGMMKDKDYMRMIEELLPFTKKVYTVSPDPYRGFAPRVVARQLQEKGIEAQPFDSTRDLIAFLKSQTDTEEKFIICGSLYLIGDIKIKWK